jgi:carbon monoxide dehydrogenase subunit G
MEMSGSQLLAMPQAAVWAGLNDAEVLRECLPGCESLERISETEFRARIVAAVGPIKSTFTGKLLLSDIDAPHAYRMTFEGTGGAAGSAKGGGQVSLAPEEAGTRLTYTAKAQVAGKLAQVGSRLIDGVARKLVDEFFLRFTARVSPPPAATAAPPPAKRDRSVARPVAIAVLVVVVLAGLWYFLR